MLPDLKILFDGPDDVKSVGSSASNQERHFFKKKTLIPVGIIVKLYL